MLEIFWSNLQILFTILQRTCCAQLLFLYVSVYMIIKSEIGGQNLNERTVKYLMESCKLMF